MPVSGDFQRRRQQSATTAHRALPVRDWPALGMPWGTARSNAASAVCGRCGGACSCGRTERVVCGGCGFSGVWRCPEEEAALGNCSAHSPASMRVASPGHAKGHCKLKCSLCSLGQPWWSLHCWELRQAWAGVFWGLRFYQLLDFCNGGCTAQHPQRTDPFQCVSGQP